MKNAFFALFMALAPYATAQTTVPLYEGTAPGSEKWSWSEAENNDNAWKTRVVYNVSQPTLTVFRPAPEKANGTALVIAPGGAFHALSIDSEGNDVAKWLAERGVTCFVLKYRLVKVDGNDPVSEVDEKMAKKQFDQSVNDLLPLAVMDGRAAIQYVREHAAEYGVLSNRIGIMGFSAGGTVAASTLFGYTFKNRPDFVAPIYPYFPAGMIGEAKAGAPPLFILTASDDGLGLAPHSVGLYSAWLNAKLDAELHMLARGNHGFGMRKQNLPSDNWIQLFYEWMQVQGLTKAPDPLLKPYERKVFEFEGNALPFRILFPLDYDRNKKYPLVLLLHGAGERGNDNETHLTHGAKLFLNQDNREKYPAIVVIPQCPKDSYWSSGNVDRSTQPLTISFDYSKPAMWPLQASNELVKHLAKTEGVDQSRIYVTGLSMGGMGTFESVFRYPELYAAALPICGGGDEKAYDARVKKTKFWIFHGADDAVVSVKHSQAMAARLKFLKVPASYTEYPGVNHNSWDNAFADPNFLTWMFSQKRK